MKLDKSTLLSNGNASLAVGALWGVGLFACPCPVCLIGSASLVANGIREKLGIEIPVEGAAKHKAGACAKKK
ncbi:MAG: hypothetical protein WC506_05115 [Candidatus Micrarchaeia archaeon]